MKILVVGLVKNPQFLRVKEEGERRGHQVDGCYSSDLIINASPEKFEVFLKNEKIPLTEYDLVYMWAISKRRWDWYVAAHFLNKNFRTIIVNSKSIDPSYNYYLSSSSEYLKQTENNLPYPKSTLIFSERSIGKILGDYDFPLIVKISEGKQGKGVFKVDNKNHLVKKTKELLAVNSSVIIRQFIPNDGDIRVFTVGGKAIGAMKRTPTKKGEFRSNISQGGRGENFVLDNYPNIKDIAESLSLLTRTEIAGIDIILDKNTGKPYILEINPGPQFTGFEKYTGINAAEKIVEYFEELRKEA